MLDSVPHHFFGFQKDVGTLGQVFFLLPWFWTYIKEHFAFQGTDKTSFCRQGLGSYRGCFHGYQYRVVLLSHLRYHIWNCYLFHNSCWYRQIQLVKYVIIFFMSSMSKFWTFKKAIYLFQYGFLKFCKSPWKSQRKLHKIATNLHQWFFKISK